MRLSNLFNKIKSLRKPFTKTDIDKQKQLLGDIKPFVEKQNREEMVQQNNLSDKAEGEIQPFTDETLKDAKKELKNDKDKLTNLQPVPEPTIGGPRMDFASFRATADKLKKHIENRENEINRMENIFDKNSKDFNQEFSLKGVGYSNHAIKEIERNVDYQEDILSSSKENLINEFNNVSSNDVQKDSSPDLEPEI
ncbi:hypothetical protein [Aquimarina macrocephali]|uniref:hypothetical protein n=1 Tax=Aquimarina macrocephali TaxID=666563 RepID=UPI000464ED54|nr:hypothetical protein [Aquimarina macrocephali]